MHTYSNGLIMGGSGGHSDIAYGAKLTIIVAPLVRARTPVVVDRVTSLSTPGDCIDVFVTQRGVAVNPKRPELKQRLKDAGMPVKDIHELWDYAKKIAGEGKKAKMGDKVVANIIGRDGKLNDRIYKMAE